MYMHMHAYMCVCGYVYNLLIQSVIPGNVIEMEWEWDGIKHRIRGFGNIETCVLYGLYTAYAAYIHTYINLHNTYSDGYGDIYIYIYADR